MATKKKQIITQDLKCAFNDFCMREMKLDVTDDDKVYDMNILEFFNTISYAIYKNKKQEEALNKYRRTH